MRRLFKFVIGFILAVTYSCKTHSKQSSGYRWNVTAHQVKPPNLQLLALRSRKTIPASAWSSKLPDCDTVVDTWNFPKAPAKLITFRYHSVKRMLERNISCKQVVQALLHGKSIDESPFYEPLPRKVILGHVGERMLNVVVAINKAENEAIVVTAYWNNNDF